MKFHLKIPTLIVYLFLIFNNVFSQSIELRITAKDSTDLNVLQSTPYIKFHYSNIDVFKEIDKVSDELALKGYINSEYVIDQNHNSYTCNFKLNIRIKKIRIHIENRSLDSNLMKEISTNFSALFFETSTDLIELQLIKIKDYFINKGNTFTKVSLNNIQLVNNILTAKLIIQNSKKRKFDTVIIKGYDELPIKIIKNKLHYKEKTIFNKKELERITEKLNTIPYIDQTKNPEVLFKKDSTILYLYISKKTKNQFNGLLGFSNKEGSNKIGLTGFINLELYNIFNRGENIIFNWRNSINKKNSLELIFKNPNFFKSKFGVEGNFNLQRSDSTFTNQRASININYNYLKRQSIGLTASFDSSHTNITNTAFNFKNYSKNLFGFSYTLEHSKTITDFLSLNINFLIGNRFSNLKREKQKRIQVKAEYSTKLSSKSLIYIKNSTKILISDDYFQNELYQIGGFNSIRGFNEQSILTASYNITNIEYQINLNTKNYLFTVSDVGFINNNTNESIKRLIGLGLGYNFGRDNTNFNLSYVLGKTNLESFLFSNAKFHIKMSYLF